MLELILIALAAGAATAIYYVVVLLIQAVMEWFTGRDELLDEDTLAFTIREKLESGKVKVVQGFFDTTSANVKASRTIEAEKLDDQLAEIHRDDDLAVFQH